MSFVAASSLGKWPRILTARLSFAFRASMAFVTGMTMPVPTSGWDKAVLAYGATIRDRGTGSTKCGQADVHDELRARVSSWPPLRLARLRRERGSVGVVSPDAPVLSKDRRTHCEKCDRTGYPPHLRRGGGLGRRPAYPARPCQHDPHGTRGLRQRPAPERRSGRGGDRQRDGVVRVLSPFVARV